MISLNYIDTGDAIDREMTVIKSRGTHHSRKHENFHISDNGIVFFSKISAQGG
jgi:KaiC/GvpD/RAD55 family RecA-like ATPase